MKAIEFLTGKSACQESLDWVGDRTPRQAWGGGMRGEVMVYRRPDDKHLTYCHNGRFYPFPDTRVTPGTIRALVGRAPLFSFSGPPYELQPVLTVRLK